jgi:MFS family permease
MNDWQSSPTSSGIFYGWWIVATSCAVLTIWSWTGFYAFGNMFIPLEEQFGWTRGQIAVGQSSFMICGGLGGVLMGRLVSQYGIKKLVIVGGLILSTSLFLLSTTNSLWQLYLFYAMAGFGGAFSGVVPFATVVSNWFRVKRGRAMGLTMMGLALGALIFSPITALIVSEFGWRVAFVVMGVGVLCVNFPATLILRTKPQEMGLHPDGITPAPEPALFPVQASGGSGNAGMVKERSAFSIAMKSPAFWFVAAGFFFMGIGTLGILNHLVPYVRDMGVSVKTAGLVLGIFGGSGAIGKIGFGLLSEKCSVRYGVMLSFSLQATGAFILLQATSLPVVWLYVAVSGPASGGVMTVLPLSVGALFPLRVFGTVFGMVNLALSTGASLIGPPLAGFLYDHYGTYNIPFTAFIGMYLCAIVLIYFAWGISPRLRGSKVSFEG